MNSAAEPSIRHQLASLLAEYFLHHLKSELTKSPELLRNITTEGVTFQIFIENMIQELVKGFPHITGNTEVNLFEEWVKRRDVPPL